MEPGPVMIGAVLAGKYRVDRVLGQGGMGVVVQAMHLQLHQPVAMKFLLPEVLGSPQIVQRFLREAQAAVRLKSEHVARVIDVGSLESGAPYMVLEYLEGADLSSFPGAQLTVGGIIDLMLQACEDRAQRNAPVIHHEIPDICSFQAAARPRISHSFSYSSFFQCKRAGHSKYIAPGMIHLRGSRPVFSTNANRGQPRHLPRSLAIFPDRDDASDPATTDRSQITMYYGSG